MLTVKGFNRAYEDTTFLRNIRIIRHSLASQKTCIFSNTTTRTQISF